MVVADVKGLACRLVSDISSILGLSHHFETQSYL
jgi:hypothetical protein